MNFIIFVEILIFIKVVSIVRRQHGTYKNCIVRSIQ